MASKIDQTQFITRRFSSYSKIGLCAHTVALTTSVDFPNRQPSPFMVGESVP